jgi:hypothetical protein
MLSATVTRRILTPWGVENLHIIVNSITIRPLRSLAILLAVLGIALTATVSAAAAQYAGDRAFVVDLAADGSATVTVHLAHDFDFDEE